MADEKVGKYMTANFVASYQKISNFRIEGTQKQGGNVASYFCLPDGTVFHAIAGPVDAATFLREARWVVESRKLAQMLTPTDRPKAQLLFRKLHCDRLAQEQSVFINRAKLPNANVPPQRLHTLRALTGLQGTNLNAQAEVHLLLAAHPLPRITQVYGLVFNDILGQRISTAPVVVSP